VAQALKPGDPRWAGPYELLERLGSGGMGQVFLGRSPGGRPVAVKVIRPELLGGQSDFRDRFAREVAAARRVNALFTAPVVDAQPDGDMPWLVTAYVPGPSLADAVSEHGPMRAGVLRSLAAGLAEGLAAIHAAGVVHRDLKPSNVLLAADGPRIIDFGISRAVDASALTGTGSPSPSDHSAATSDSALVSSTLLAATTTGLPDRRSTAATVASASVTPTVASTTNKIASAASTATRAWPATRAARLCVLSTEGSQPPVSTRVKERPRQRAS